MAEQVTYRVTPRNEGRPLYELKLVSGHSPGDKCMAHMNCHDQSPDMNHPYGSVTEMVSHVIDMAENNNEKAHITIEVKGGEFLLYDIQDEVEATPHSGHTVVIKQVS